MSDIENGPGPGRRSDAAPRRADAQRNVCAIVDAATRLLGVDPTTDMSEIAAAAGVARATLYRHFPSRGVLVEAIHARAFDDAEQAIRGSRPEEGPAIDALRRTVAALLTVGDRYRVIAPEWRVDETDKPRNDREERVGAPLLALVERGQRSGELRPDVPVRWIAAVFGALVHAALREVAAGRLQRADAERYVVESLLGGIVAGPR